MAILFLKQFITNTVALLITHQGFIYIPAGVSSGLIKWANVQKVEETHVVANSSSGSSRELALAVTLHNPEEYYQNFNTLVKPLLKLGSQMYGAPILIYATRLDYDYEELKALFMRYVATANPKYSY